MGSRYQTITGVKSCQVSRLNVNNINNNGLQFTINMSEAKKRTMKSIYNLRINIYFS